MILKIKVTEDLKFEDIAKYLDKLGFCWNTGIPLLGHIPEKNPKWVLIYLKSRFEGIGKYIKYSSNENYQSNAFELNIIEEVGAILSEVEDLVKEIKSKYPEIDILDIQDKVLHVITEKLKSAEYNSETTAEEISQLLREEEFEGNENFAVHVGNPVLIET